MSLMRQEALEFPKVLRTQLAQNQPILMKLAAKLRENYPEFVLTVARGSSDHAATFVKYLCETQFGLAVSSAAPSVYTLYKAPVHLAKSLVVALSQSGQSPDICEVMRYAKENKALSVAFVNETRSPLAQLAEYVVPLHAGKEKAVAATKSYMAMLAATLHFTAIFKEDTQLLTALEKLPAQLESLQNLDFTPYLPLYEHAQHTLVIGRGFEFPIAEEIALKFKEVTQLHAESFSSAEVLHGPFSLFNEAFPVLLLLQNDPSLPSLHDLISRIRQTPVHPLLIGDAISLVGNEDLQHIRLPETHPLLTPTVNVFVVYQFLEALAVHKGLDPDTHPLLQKVTKTV